MNKLKGILSGIMSVIIAGSCFMAVMADSYIEDPFWATNPKPSSPSESLSYYDEESNIVWTSDDKNIKGYANGEIQEYQLISADNLIVVPSDSEISNDILELSEDYSISDVTDKLQVTFIKDKIDLDGKKVYLISNTKNLKDTGLSENLKKDMISEKIDASFNLATFNFEPKALSAMSIELNEADEDFTPDKYEGLKGLEFAKTSDDATRYAVNISAINISDIDKIESNVKEDSNVKSVKLCFNQSTLGYAQMNYKADYIRIDGDSNSDNRLNVRDCSFIAQKLAQKKTEELPEYSDYNLDGKADVRDAAGVARFLSNKYTEQ